MNGANDACKNEHVPSCYYADIQHPPVVKKKGKKTSAAGVPSTTKVL
jgi:hypothetical protein